MERALGELVGDEGAERASARSSHPLRGEGPGVGDVVHRSAHPEPPRRAPSRRVDASCKGEGRRELPDVFPGTGDPIRLWLRLLTCTNLIEGEIRRRLRARFGVTLPRFDLLAQLDREPDGLTLSAISRRMMVSNGNVTGLVERLARSGHVERRASATDRRSQVVRLTELGRAEFAAMAAAHRSWLQELFAPLGAGRADALMGLLAHTKASVRKAGSGATP